MRSAFARVIQTATACGFSPELFIGCESDDFAASLGNEAPQRFKLDQKKLARVADSLGEFRACVELRRD
jgi:hypothetical protein